MDDDVKAGLLVALAMILFCLLGWAFGSMCTEYAMQKEAIEAQVAEWRIDSTTGKRYFHYGCVPDKETTDAD